MRLLGNLFGHGTKPPNKNDRPARQRSPAGARSTPGKESSLAALAVAAPALWIAEDGATILDDVVSGVRRFVFMTDDHAATCALFALHAHCLNAVPTSPLLAISAPTNGCGKTTLLRVMAGLVPSPLFVSDITAAALYRTLNTDKQTLPATKTMSHEIGVVVVDE